MGTLEYMGGSTILYEGGEIGKDRTQELCVHRPGVGRGQICASNLGEERAAWLRGWLSNE